MDRLVEGSELERLDATVNGRLPSFLDDLERLVNIDCGSYSKAGVDEVGSWTTRRLEELGGVGHAPRR